MARRMTGVSIKVDGLEKMLAGNKRGYSILGDVVRDILRGPFGEQLKRDVKSRMSDHDRTGWMSTQVGVKDDGLAGVRIGVINRGAKHPHSNASAGAIGQWLESGTRMHLIPTRVTRYSHVAFGGRVVSRVAHPGTRAYRIMQTTLRVNRNEATQLIIKELDARLAPKMGLNDAAA